MRDFLGLIIEYIYTSLFKYVSKIYILCIYLNNVFIYLSLCLYSFLSSYEHIIYVKHTDFSATEK